MDRISHATLLPLPQDRLDPNFMLEPMDEEQTSGASFVRISRVKNVQETPVRSTPANR
jgi:hypothetical protein